MTPFDFVNAINSPKKQDLITENPDCEREYVPFLVNKSLSYFADSIMYSNAMNLHNSLENKLQFHYLLNSLRPAKRFSKWVKRDENDDLEIVKTYYGYSTSKAKQALHLLSSQQISILREKLQGGIEDDRN